MRINITDFFNHCDPMDYSASRHEIGNDAGEVTWMAALTAPMLLGDPDNAPASVTSDAFDAAFDFLVSTGGWTADEVSQFSLRELNALVVQFIASEIRQCDSAAERYTAGVESDTWWNRYYAQASDGSIAGRLSNDDTGAVFFDLGN